MLPEIDGVAILRTIRASGVKTPVLLLTALGGIDDRVEGLEAGADDYLVKPFAFAELLARVNALARRPPPQEVRTELIVADLKIDRVTSFGQRTLEIGGGFLVVFDDEQLHAWSQLRSGGEGRVRR
jgi:two-component system OmpR family response regulator